MVEAQEPEIFPITDHYGVREYLAKNSQLLYRESHDLVKDKPFAQWPELGHLLFDFRRMWDEWCDFANHGNVYVNVYRATNSLLYIIGPVIEAAMNYEDEHQVSHLVRPLLEVRDGLEQCKVAMEEKEIVLGSSDLRDELPRRIESKPPYRKNLSTPYVYFYVDEQEGDRK